MNEKIVEHLNGIADAIREDIKVYRDDRDQQQFLRGELFGIQQAIDIVTGVRS